MVKKKVSNGIVLHHCPNCNQWYTPKHVLKSESPLRTIYREQHMTGICSDLCWNEYLGVEE